MWLKAYVQKEHSCGSSTWWPTGKTSMAWSLRRYILLPLKVLAADIHWQLMEVYSNDMMSRQQVARWCWTFASCKDSVTDDNRCGWQNCSTIEVSTANVKELIQMDRHVSLWHVASDLGLACSTVHHVVADVLQYCKVCVRWMPCSLTDGDKAARMMACISFLQHYTVEGNNCLCWVIAGDERGIHHFTHIKWSTTEWKHAGSPRAPSAGTGLGALFWDLLDVLQMYFLEYARTVNSDKYCAHWKAIWRKRPNVLSSAVILLSANAWPHMAQHTGKLPQNFSSEMLDHPPYSPDLAPIGFHLFHFVNEHLSWLRFTSHEDIKQQGRAFYISEIDKVITCCDRCLDCEADYIKN
jgi:histone-lysine N-methyltransferase SETMAR